MEQTLCLFASFLSSNPVGNQNRSFNTENCLSHAQINVNINIPRECICHRRGSQCFLPKRLQHLVIRISPNIDCPVDFFEATMSVLFHAKNDKYIVNLLA